MISRLKILATAFALFVAASSLAGCSFEPGERTQLVRQECFNDDQCVSGAICVERRCQYEGTAQTPDAGDPDDASPSDVPVNDEVWSVDVGGDQDIAVQDAGQAACNPGETRCLGNSRYEYCRDDGTGFDTRTCEEEFYCDSGECVPVDQSECHFQNQPCDEEGQSNGYYCGDLFNNGDQMRCIGLCDSTADNPGSTCPDVGSACVPIQREDFGFCMSACNLDEGCDTPGYGCLPTDGLESEGMCMPTNSDNEIGDRCDPDDYLDCEAGALCVDLQTGGRCVEACRSFTAGSDTDCSSGHCVPLTASQGICQPDAGNLAEGDSCRRRQIFQTCNDDAVICAPSGNGQGPQCTRLCRLAEGDSDCSGQQSCFQYDDERDDLGVCVNGAP